MAVLMFASQSTFGFLFGPRKTGIKQSLCQKVNVQRIILRTTWEKEVKQNHPHVIDKQKTTIHPAKLTP